MTIPKSRAEAEALDAQDPLRDLRGEFLLPEDLIYLDGNSLGPLSESARARVFRVVTEEWGKSLIKSWNAHGWIDLPLRVGDSIATLIGAGPGEVAATDSTSVNLFKVLSAALRLRPGRNVILSEEDNFPSDLYMAQGLSESLGGGVTAVAVPGEGLTRSLNDNVAVLMLTHVDFRTGSIHDMNALNRAAHAAGALTVWDLSHSAGALEIDLNGTGADFAVGCGYKYLNGGPGAPAFIFAAKRHHEDLRSPLSGWLGHASPFAFETRYRPAPGIARFLCGTPPILSLAALEEGVKIILKAGLPALLGKSKALTRLFIDLMEDWAPAHGFVLASPRDANRRGSQVSYHYPQGYAVVQALIHEGVVGDFRAPDLLRFGFAPAYIRFADVWNAVARLKEIVETRRWDRPEFRVQAKVT
jgi:kynureninase